MEKFNREIPNNLKITPQEVKADIELTKDRIKNMTTYSSTEIVAAQEAEIKVEQEGKHLEQIK